MIDVINLKEMPEGIVELGGRVEILSCKDMTPRIFPKPLDDIEGRRIWRQEYEADSKFGSLIFHCSAMLIPRVVENEGFYLSTAFAVFY